MKIKVSNGEILDKFSILEIKLSKIKDPIKIKNVKIEYKHLKDAVKKIKKETRENNLELEILYSKLLDVNLKLWEIEDSLRKMEKERNFGFLFVETARSVYYNNDKRADIKKEINKLTKSDIFEEKSYVRYG